MSKISVQRDTLADILNASTSVGNLAVCLASAKSDAPAPRYRLLQITRRLASEFRISADNLHKRLSKDLSKGDLALRGYDAGSKPDPHEVEHLDLNLFEEIKNQVDPLAYPARLSLFDTEEEEFVSDLRFYAIVIQPSTGNPTLYFSAYTGKRELSRSKFFGALFERGQFDQIRRPTFLFDYNLDCFCRGSDMFITSKGGFQQAFRFYELMTKAAKDSLRAIRQSIPIANFDEFAASCESHLQKLAKLKNIAAKDYLGQVTIEQLKATIQRKKLPVEVVVKDGKEMLLFDPSDRWIILRLLDDDYLDSLMTGYSYEVTGKRVLE